jgi:hypothetical protein
VITGCTPVVESSGYWGKTFVTNLDAYQFSLSAEQQVFLLAFLDFHVVMSVIQV